MHGCASASIQWLWVLFIYYIMISFWQNENYIDNENTLAGMKTTQCRMHNKYSDCSLLVHSHTRMRQHLACFSIVIWRVDVSSTIWIEAVKQQNVYIVCWNELYGFWTDVWHWHTLLVPRIGCHFCDDIILFFYFFLCRCCYWNIDAHHQSIGTYHTLTHSSIWNYLLIWCGPCVVMPFNLPTIAYSWVRANCTHTHTHCQRIIKENRSAYDAGCCSKIFRFLSDNLFECVSFGRFCRVPTSIRYQKMCSAP